MNLNKKGFHKRSKNSFEQQLVEDKKHIYQPVK